jgi:Pyruvate/2-oxoacid:ferredoxin oxidoreductase delta subunit
MWNAPPCPLPEREEGEKKSTRRRASSLPRAMTREEARSEAARCLSLRVCEGCEVCELICPDQAITRDPVTGHPVIDLSLCKGCGLCAHFCPKGAIAMVLEQG